VLRLVKSIDLLLRPTRYNHGAKWNTEVCKIAMRVVGSLFFALAGSGGRSLVEGAPRFPPSLLIRLCLSPYNATPRHLQVRHSLDYKSQISTCYELRSGSNVAKRQSTESHKSWSLGPEHGVRLQVKQSLHLYIRYSYRYLHSTLYSISHSFKQKQSWRRRFRHSRTSYYCSFTLSCGPTV
jgi:hypothetical protein